MVEEATIDILNKAPWDTIAPRLLRYAYCLSGGSPIPGGHTPEDVVEMAIERVYTGTRRWNPAEYEDLTSYLMGVVRSILSKKGLYGLKERDAMDFRGHEEMEAMPATQDWLSDSDKATAFDALESEIGDDEELGNILAAFKMGYSKSGDIAEATGMPEKRVYELKRKLMGYACRAARQLADNTAGGECNAER